MFVRVFISCRVTYSLKSCKENHCCWQRICSWKKKFGFKVPSIQEESEDTTPSESTYAPQSILSLRRPLNVVRKLVTTQRRSSLQKLSSSITNLTEVRGKASQTSAITIYSILEYNCSIERHKNIDSISLAMA